jgi:hypothetical protein
MATHLCRSKLVDSFRIWAILFVKEYVVYGALYSNKYIFWWCQNITRCTAVSDYPISYVWPPIGINIRIFWDTTKIVYTFLTLIIFDYYVVALNTLQIFANNIVQFWQNKRNNNIVRINVYHWSKWYIFYILVCCKKCAHIRDIN